MTKDHALRCLSGEPQTHAEATGEALEVLEHATQLARLSADAGDCRSVAAYLLAALDALAPELALMRVGAEAK